MKFTVGTAAKETGKAKSTISRYISSGKLSATKKPGGAYEIDAAELFRVFPRVEQSNSSGNGQMERTATPKVNGETGKETKALETEVKLLRELINAKDDTIDDLRRRLDEEAEERRKLTLLLTHEREDKPARNQAQDGTGGLFSLFRGFKP